MNRKLCYLYLTCGENEKEDIARTLLDKHLVACAKFLPVDALYWWHGKIERANETLIVFESAEDLFGEVETELKKIHSYDTFVLTALPMIRVSTKAAEWLNENLQAMKHRVHEA